MDALIKKLLISSVFGLSLLYNSTALAFEKYIESQSFGIDTKIKILNSATRLRYVVAEFFVRGENGERVFLPHPRLIHRGETLTIPFGLGARLQGEGKEEINEIIVRHRPTESLQDRGNTLIPGPEPGTQERIDGPTLNMAIHTRNTGIAEMQRTIIRRHTDQLPPDIMLGLLLRDIDNLRTSGLLHLDKQDINYILFLGEIENLGLLPPNPQSLIPKDTGLPNACTLSEAPTQWTNILGNSDYIMPMVGTPIGSAPPYIVARVYNSHDPSTILQYFLLPPGEVLHRFPSPNLRIDFIPYNYPNLAPLEHQIRSTTDIDPAPNATTTAPRSRLANFFGALLQAADLLGNSDGDK